MHLIWEEFLKIIKEEAGSQIVETWFKAVTLEDWNASNNTVTLRMPNQFVSKWIQEHYTELLKTHLGRLLQAHDIKLFFISNIQATNDPKIIIPASVASHELYHHFKDYLFQPPQTLSVGHRISNNSSPQSLAPIEKKHKPKEVINLNENYVFESFVVGPSNSLAHAAAIAIAGNLGKAYNPLFIYGGTGLGKTHLLHAIGNEAKKKNVNTHVRYETTDHFITEFINSIRFDKSDLFRSKYQKVDLLLLDDVQFLSNKEQTQESFFHIFNTLYEQQKQIVLSSDTFPKEIMGLQSRLKSRMEWGLVADIQLPDLETKIAILKKKALINNLHLPDEVADFIASRVTSNIRELEGALIRVGAFSSLTNQAVTLEMARRVLLTLNEKRKDGILLENVLKIVAKNYGISINDLRSKKRHKNLVIVRQVALFLMKKLTISSLQAIGSFVGGRDHSTVTHAISKIEVLLKQDTSFGQKVKSIEQEILMS